jgi:hypothetical protein
VDVDYLRKGEYEVDVTNLSGYDEKIKREEILNFLDPAALYGRYFEKKVKFYDTIQSKMLITTTVPGSNFIYTKLIEKFYSRNRLYLDIRSEKGYSYNFYENYADANSNNIQTGHGTGNLTPQRYQTNNWPILIIDNALTTTQTENILRLQLRIDDNTKPILYLKGEANGKIKVTDNAKDYIKIGTLIKNGNNPLGTNDLTAWTNRFSLKFPNTQDGNSRKYIGSYIKMNYFRTLHNEASPNTVLKNQYYYDSAFCSIDIPNIGNPNTNVKEVKGAEPVYVREPNNEDGTGNFQLNMMHGAYWDAGRILFYATLQYRDTDLTSEKDFLNTYSQKLKLNDNDLYNNSELRRRTEIICREYEIETNNIIIPGINFYESKDLGGNNYTKNNKECAMLLGLTIDELNSIKNDMQMDKRHHRFIHLDKDANNPQITVADGNNVQYRYYKYTLQLQGFDSNGNRNTVTPLHNNTPITVYSRDNQFFSTALFSASEPLTTGQNGQNQLNRVEFHIYHDGVVKINDNIDFALIVDNQNQIAGKQNIFYFYHDANNTITNIHNSGLELVIANKMERHRTKFDQMDSTYNILVRNYANEGVAGVDASYTNRNNNGDLMTAPGTAKAISDYKYRKYINQKKKVFMVKFVTQDDRNPTNIVFTSNTPFINVSFQNTLRLYGNPDLVAAVIGALVQFNGQITCQGLAYEDASCYPSKEHVNGEALDTDYLSKAAIRPNPDRDVDFILALSDFGFGIFRIASTNYSFATNIYNNTRLDTIRAKLNRDTPTDTYQLHSGHLHSTSVVIKNDINRTL